MSNTIGTIESMTIRAADYGDRAQLIELAQRDSSRIPDGALLVAEVGGSIRAAVAVQGGRTIADPFSPTADMIGMLHARADQLDRRRRKDLRIVASSAGNVGRIPLSARAAS